MTEFIQIWTYFNYTVEALISGHHEGKDICPLIIVVRFVESEILQLSASC